MTLQITRWSPDTCSCIIEYSWDSDVPVIERIHTAYRIIKQCPIHAGLVGKDNIFNGVHSENVFKNEVVNHVKDNSTDNLEPRWQFDIDRNLIISCGADKSKKRDMQDTFDLKYGVGKVKVQ